MWAALSNVTTRIKDKPDLNVEQRRFVFLLFLFVWRKFFSTKRTQPAQTTYTLSLQWHCLFMFAVFVLKVVCQQTASRATTTTCSYHHQCYCHRKKKMCQIRSRRVINKAWKESSRCDLHFLHTYFQKLKRGKVGWLVNLGILTSHQRHRVISGREKRKKKEVKIDRQTDRETDRQTDK